MRTLCAFCLLVCRYAKMHKNEKLIHDSSFPNFFAMVAAKMLEISGISDLCMRHPKSSVKICLGWMSEIGKTRKYSTVSYAKSNRMIMHFCQNVRLNRGSADVPMM